MTIFITEVNSRVVLFYDGVIIGNLKIRLLMKAKSRKNLSFLSNQEIVESMRNKSVRNLSRNRSVQTNISLIQKKNYDSTNHITNQNTNPNISLASTNSKDVLGSHDDQGHLSKQAQNQNLMRFLKENISNKKLLSQVETFINQIPDEKQKGGISKEEAALMTKIEELYLEKTKLKKQKKLLESKIQEQSKQFQKREENLKKQNERLHKLVLKQSELITNQGMSEISGNEDLRRILLAQAKSIQILRENTKPVKAHR